MEVELRHRVLTEFLLSQDMRRIVEERAHMAEALFQAEVAKKTGMLAASAHGHTEIGGVESDRWIGVLSVGGQGAGGSVVYAGAHQFGVGDHAGSTAYGKAHPQPAHHELNQVLEQLGTV